VIIIDILSFLKGFIENSKLIMAPRRLERASLAREMDNELKKEGLSLEDLIVDLRTQRERYASEALPRD
jgi:hypothetical protein